MVTMCQCAKRCQPKCGQHMGQFPAVKNSLIDGDISCFYCNLCCRGNKHFYEDFPLKHIYSDNQILKTRSHRLRNRIRRYFQRKATSLKLKNIVVFLSLLFCLTLGKFYFIKQFRRCFI